MKKLLSLLLVLVMVLGFTACGGNEDPDEKDPMEGTSEQDGIQTPIIPIN